MTPCLAVRIQVAFALISDDGIILVQERSKFQHSSYLEVSAILTGAKRLTRVVIVFKDSVRRAPGFIVRDVVRGHR